MAARRKLCTAIEPVTKIAMCQKPVGHKGPHRSVNDDHQGQMTAEWYDTWRIRESIRGSQQK